MSKGRYRSVECKQVNWQQLIEQASGQALVFAVDVAKEAFFGLLQVKGGAGLVRIRWRHPVETGELLSGLQRLMEALPLQAVMESSGTYGDALRWQLGVRGIEVYRVSAKRVHDEAEVYDGVPSLHDAKACEIIGALHERGLSERWIEEDAERRGRKARLNMLREAKSREGQVRNRLEAQLARHWPELLELLALNSASLIALIGALGGPEQVHSLADLARKTLRQAGRPGLAEQKIEAIIKSAGNTLGMPCVLEEREHLRQLANELLDIAKRLKRLEEEIKREVGEDHVMADLAPQLGATTTLVLFALLGTPAAYPSAHSYCKAIGLNLKERSSGKHKGQLSITKRGPSLGRFYLYFAALRLIGKEPVVGRWFRAKTQRPGAVKGKQIVELMRRIAKGIWHHAQGRAFAIEKLFGPAPVALS